MQQDEGGHGADSCDKVARRRKVAQHIVQARARLLKEGAEGAHLQQQDQSGVGKHDERVYSPLCYHRPKCFRERDAIIALQHAASCELSDTGNNQTDGVRKEDGIDTDGTADLRFSLLRDRSRV